MVLALKSGFAHFFAEFPRVTPESSRLGRRETANVAVVKRFLRVFARRQLQNDSALSVCLHTQGSRRASTPD